MSDLGTLAGATSSTGIGINDAGQIVGNSLLTTGTTHGFLYSNGTLYDLNNLVSPASGVTDIALNFQGDPINNSGQIPAYGTIGGQSHALLLTPVPEPTISQLAASAATAAMGYALLRRLRSAT
jgi:probable HAF family extracellular repeat protein